MFEALIDRVRNAIDRVHTRLEPEETSVIIRDGVIVSEPPHDEEINPNAESEANAKAQKIAQYRAYAQELCAKHKREGVWIELLLLGVQISSIKDGTLDGNQFYHRIKARQHVAIVPEWCLDTMNQSDINWRVERKTVHNAFARLEIVPEDIYTLSPNYEA